jgi:hypothetical protein
LSQRKRPCSFLIKLISHKIRHPKRNSKAFT